MGSIKDRLAVIERIVTDGGYGLTAEIDKLRDDPQFQREALTFTYKLVGRPIGVPHHSTQ